LNFTTFINGAIFNIERLPECVNVTKRTVMTSVIDIVFVLDTTYSMSEEIEQAKQSVRKIISSVGSINLGDDPNRVKFGFVAYRDHSDEYVTKVRDLTNENEVLAFINGLVAMGGGDTPEAVIDGVSSAVS
jgi:hypothetical protein